MATITIKKKKPLALKANEEEAASPGAGPVLSAAPGFHAAVKEPSYTLYAILAIVAALCFLVLILLQWSEFSFYGSPPSVFPQPGASSASAPPSAS